MTTFGARVRAALVRGRTANVRGAGALAPRRSDGYEFSELRGYVDGDDPRRIDWAASARAGGLQTRVMLEENALVLAVAIDASASMSIGRMQSAYERACDAASMWFAAAAADDRCYRVGARLFAPTALRGAAAGRACAVARDAADAPLDGALRLALATLPRDARLLIASDFFDLAALEPPLRACVARFDVTALVCGDPWDGAFPLAGFVRLRDAERGDVAHAFVGRRARARYARAVERREAAAIARLASFGARAARLPATGAIEVALASALAIA